MTDTGEARFKRKPSGHLAQRAHDHVHDEADDGVGDKDRSGASLGKCRASSNDQSCASVAPSVKSVGVQGMTDIAPPMAIIVT